MNSPQPTQQAAQQAGGGFVLTVEEDFEPDSLECQLMDKFIEALMLGKGPMAESALRELKELDDEALKTFVALLEQNLADDSFFPYSLEFRYTRRGKPKHLPGADWSTPEKKLIDALMRGDRAAAGAALRDMKQVRGAALEVIAELFGHPSKSSFPIRLVFRQRRRGRPYHPLTSAVRTFAWRHAFARAEAEIIRAGKKPKTEAAVADLMQKTGRSRGTVFKARKQLSPNLADC